ncbi:MAG: DUF1523 family protein [Gemmobacter sp.]|nr:DUF1523 family protein [Gemmobacter sp.]
MYNWRLSFFSIYPNAVKIKPVSGPDVTLIPWLNIIILALLGGGLFLLWRMWEQFKERMIDPTVDGLNNKLDEIDARRLRAQQERRGFWCQLTSRR